MGKIDQSWGIKITLFLSICLSHGFHHKEVAVMWVAGEGTVQVDKVLEAGRAALQQLFGQVHVGGHSIYLAR